MCEKKWAYWGCGVYSDEGVNKPSDAKEEEDDDDDEENEGW